MLKINGCRFVMSLLRLDELLRNEPKSEREMFRTRFGRSSLDIDMFAYGPTPSTSCHRLASCSPDVSRSIWNLLPQIAAELGACRALSTKL